MKCLGFYRVFATNVSDRVVLRYTNRIVVVTPAGPDDFIRELAAIQDLTSTAL
jgi:hypothetical protein